MAAPAGMEGRRGSADGVPGLDFFVKAEGLKTRADETKQDERSAGDGRECPGRGDCRILLMLLPQWERPEFCLTTEGHVEVMGGFCCERGLSDWTARARSHVSIWT
ncbi:hypothetical protein Mapa_002334 [Marchantia paleacea]|nr:hypothetical protein Mapa_002334 [Marchantia paleacea]